MPITKSWVGWFVYSFSGSKPNYDLPSCVDAKHSVPNLWLQKLTFRAYNDYVPVKM